ncbi:hypothetical protein M9Y10_040407 [Tritrichomonas musculus]|uniref:Uncharacterized protein n=1 Tax=Tritrichomonas musculus TaxID=1915356 RepID=A0ABR2GPL7_9EUKA
MLENDEKEKILIKNSNYDVYNSIKIPELGSSIVTKLFNKIKESPIDYRPFYILKSIANKFPLLFYNRHQEIFEIMLKSFEYYHLIIDDQNHFDTAKIAYSAFSFFISTLVLPIMFDKFIVWLNENISTFSKSQIAGFISVLIRLCKNNNI